MQARKRCDRRGRVPIAPPPPPLTLPPQMSRLNLLPAAGHVGYSEEDEVEDEDDADNGVGSSRRARRTEGRGREGGLDRATRSRRGSGRGRDRLNFFYPGPLCPSLIKLIKLIHS